MDSIQIPEESAVAKRPALGFQGALAEYMESKMERRNAIMAGASVIAGFAGLTEMAGAEDNVADDCCGSCGDCRAACLACVDACLSEEGREECIKLCLDCADICAACEAISARKGPMSAEMMALCAAACDKCADECEKHKDDEVCLACAEACRACAEECREFAKSTAGLYRESAPSA